MIRILEKGFSDIKTFQDKRGFSGNRSPFS